MQAWVTQFRKGLVELCVLAALRDAEAYGYAIVERLGRVAGLELTESTVYPLLARLARDGLVRVRTAPSPCGPPRRYYRLTAAGRQRLDGMARHWREVRESVNQIVEETSHDDGKDGAERPAAGAGG
jgi:PadR family transcriptional regulator PadR